MEGWAELCCCIAARISQLKSRRSSWTLAEGSSDSNAALSTRSQKSFLGHTHRVAEGW